MGCYTGEGFTNILGKKSPYLQDFDLQFFREHGYCMRYKEGSYWNATHPPPPPKPTPAIESSPTGVPSLAPNTTAAVVSSESSASSLSTPLSAAAQSASSTSTSLISVTSSPIPSPSIPIVESKKGEFAGELKQVVHT